MISEQTRLDFFLSEEKPKELHKFLEKSKEERKERRIIQKEATLKKSEIKKTEDEFTLEKVKELYENKKIPKDYAFNLLTTVLFHKNPEEYLSPGKFYDYVNEKSEILSFLCKISPKSERLYVILEEVVVSHTWYNLRIYAMELLEKCFPKRAKKTNLYVIENDLYLIPYILKHYKSIKLRKLAQYISNPVVKLYFYDKWFFKKYHFRFNAHEKRIFGHPKNTWNLKMKIQLSNGPYRIYNDNGSGLKYIKKYCLSELLECEIKEVDSLEKYQFTKSLVRVMDIYQQKRYFYGITYKFFNKLIKDILKLFDLQNDDLEFNFIRNYSVSLLYLEIKKIGLGIAFPAKKFKIQV